MNDCGKITKPYTRLYNTLYLNGFIENPPAEIKDDMVLYHRNFIKNTKLSRYMENENGQVIMRNGRPVTREDYFNNVFLETMATEYGMNFDPDTKVFTTEYPEDDLPYIKVNMELLEKLERFGYEYRQNLIPPTEEGRDAVEPDDFTEEESPNLSINTQEPTLEKGQYKLFSKVNEEGIMATEKTIRDLAARMSARIGIPFQIISDRTQEFKGKIENETAVINLAYASLDTPIHEILGHPIIRALKNIDAKTPIDKSKRFSDEYFDYFRKLQEEGKTVKQAEELANKKFDIKPNTLYQNLLKELEYGRGKEVLDRIKRDYPIKNIKQSGAFVKWLQDKGIVSTEEFKILSFIGGRGEWTGENDLESFKKFVSENALKYREKYYNQYISDIKPKIEFTFEDQQEEAIVELLGLYTADRIDATKNLKLVSLLKQLLGRIKAFVRSLLFEREVDINKLPDNMTIGDIADLLAYSNNKLILPGNEVIYTTPDNQQFKTYGEASKHISDLAKSIEEVDLSTINLKKDLSKEQLEEIARLEKEIQEKEAYLNSEEYQKNKQAKLDAFNKELDALLSKEVTFYSQEPNLTREDANKYGFKDYSFVRVESSYSRKKTTVTGVPLWEKEFGKDFEGYYIHGYNTQAGKPDFRVLKITKEQAEEIWRKYHSKYPFDSLEYADRQRIYFLRESLISIENDSNIKYSIQDLGRKINDIKIKPIERFIESNKEYEQSKEIIEEWKRVNNIQYNPEEVYSRGQEFVSVVGAYSNFDVNLMMQNLLQHIEDNQKAGGEFIISAFTKPVDKNIGHLEGGGGKIKFKIYPKSADIKWAANSDVYSGSVWDASEKVSKDKKSELLGVSYTKYPSLSNVNAVQPSLASIVDNLAHHHNELGISLTGNNFRLEYDEDIPYSTKKIIDAVNSILDQRYGKLVKPEITIKGKFEKKYELVDDYGIDGGTETLRTFDTLEEAKQAAYELNKKENYLDSEYGVRYSYREVTKSIGIQPTQTNETLKESIESITNKKLTPKSLREELNILLSIEPFGLFDKQQERLKYLESLTNEELDKQIIVETDYTSQALINTKIAKLKEVAKKYPRSLITSEVRPIGDGTQQIGFRYQDVFQKIPTTPDNRTLKPNQRTSDFDENKREQYFRDFYSNNQNIDEDTARDFFDNCML